LVVDNIMSVYDERLKYMSTIIQTSPSNTKEHWKKH